MKSKQSINFVISFVLGALISISYTSYADDKAEFFFSAYTDNDGLDVLSPSFLLTKDIQDTLSVGFAYIHETFDKSANAFSSSPDAVSGATTVVGGSGSNFNETRQELGGFANYTVNNTVLKTGLFYGEEPDFVGGTVTLGVDHSLFENNFTLSGRLSYEQDDIDKLDAEPQQVFPKRKTVNRAALVATQLLSPTALIIGGVALENQRGYLSSPTRRIAVQIPIPGGFSQKIVDEQHPDKRDRRVYFVRVKKYFESKSAMDVNFSHYTDNWDIDAFSSEIRFSQYLSPQLIARLRYRLYSQDEGSFYKENYAAEESIMTADNRLRNFTSKLYGFQLRYFPRLPSIPEASFTFTYDTYKETNNGLDADNIQIILAMPF